MTKAAFKKLRDRVCRGKISAKLAKEPPVAVLAGPSLIVEIIVRHASIESGIEMDWGYVGGRAIVHAKGDRRKARRALFMAVPDSDLTMNDL